MFTKKPKNKEKTYIASIKIALVFLFVTVYVFCLNSREFANSGFVSMSQGALMSKLGGADSGNYLRLALDLRDFNVSPENYWIVGLWPPGMAIFDFICLMLPGNFVIWVFIATALIAALPVSIVINRATNRREFFLAALLSLIYLVEPNRVWALTSGIFNSDGIGSSFLLSSALLLVFSFQDGSKRVINGRTIDRWLIASGCLLAISLSFRWAYITIAVGLVVGFSSYLILLKIVKPRNQKTRNDSKIPLRKFLASIAIAALPWTSFVYLYLHPGNPSWSTGDYQWAQRWMSDDFLIAGNANWLVEGGANWGCKIDQEKCRILESRAESGSNNFAEFRDEAIATAIARPLQLFALKTPIIVSSFESTAGQPTFKRDNQVGGIIFMWTLLACTVLAFTRRNSRVLMLYLLYIGLALAALYLAHVETRYLLPVWDLGILGLVYSVLNNLVSTKSTQESERVEH